MQSRKALVLYGSETGNAQDTAEEIGCMLERLHFLTHVTQLDAVEPSSLITYHFAVISVSTTGQGELPNNARLFWKKLLRKKLTSLYLQDALFAVFGLGDSSYPQYNWAARKLHRRLLQLGATELYTRGEADEQHAEGRDAVLFPWMKDLREKLVKRFPLPDDMEPIASDEMLQPKWLLSRMSGETLPEVATNPTDRKTQPNCVHVEAKLMENRRITAADHWQDVRHLTLASPSKHDYKPGDVLTVYPQNAPEDVQFIIQLMKWDDVADLSIQFSPNPAAHSAEHAALLPSPSLDPYVAFTLRQFLTNHLDLNAIPRRSFFALIAHFTDDDFQKEKLVEFTKYEFIDELFDYTTRPRRSILEVLQEFNTVHVPWQWASTVLPKLRGRQFSIASGGQLKHDDSGNTIFELLVAIVKYRTVIKKIRQGVCTRYLAGLSVGAVLNVSLQRGGVRVTDAEMMRPVVMICPGTGLAPMRSLIWERYHWQKSINTNGNSKINKPYSIGQSVLIFGCRNRQSDYYFKDEWKQLTSHMDLQVFTAFSRDQDEKIYVQDIIKQNAKLIHRRLHTERGIVCICGSSGKMPQAVREALTAALQKGGNMNQDVAQAYLATMDKENRYKLETW